MDYMISFPAKMKRLMGFVYTKLCSVFFLNFSDVALNRMMIDDPKSYIRL